MTAKDVKKAIITLIILLIGVNILWYIGKSAITNLPVTDTTNLTPAISNLMNFLSIGIIVIIVILIPVYLSKRSDDKKMSQNYGRA